MMMPSSPLVKKNKCSSCCVCLVTPFQVFIAFHTWRHIMIIPLFLTWGFSFVVIQTCHPRQSRCSLLIGSWVVMFSMVDICSFVTLCHSYSGLMFDVRWLSVSMIPCDSCLSHDTRDFHRALLKPLLSPWLLLSPLLGWPKQNPRGATNKTF